MTEGNIFRHLLLFALPLLAGNLFQQLYNMVDTWVVGNFASNEAFSAVGTVNPVINMLIGFFMGFSAGAGVVISQYYGAKQFDKVRKAVHTAIVLTAILSVVFTILGTAMTPLMVRLMKTPAEVAPEQETYLSIYFSGITGLLFYNMGAAILRAVGDSRKPFYFLVVCAVMNTVLDLVFVKDFCWGVRGVALATILSQGISAVLVLVSLFRTESCVKLSLRHLQIDGISLKKTVIVGLPTALQMSITAFSNVFVQSYINHFGADFMSGWATYLKMDQLMFMPMQSIALASTTFVGQNLGSGNVARAKKGVRIAMACAFGSTLILMAPLLIFAPQLTAFFNGKPEVVFYGAKLLRLLSPFYVLCCMNQIYAGALRGAGNSRAPMIIMLSSFVVFRQIYLFIMSHFISYTIVPISLSYPAGWLVNSTVMFIYYCRTPLDKNRVVDYDATWFKLLRCSRVDGEKNFAANRALEGDTPQLILNQNTCPPFAVGSQSMGKVGCEIAAAFNALLLRGQKASCAEIIRSFEGSGYLMKAVSQGDLGSDPYAIGEYFRSRGVDCTELADFQAMNWALERGKDADASYIVSFWNSDQITDGLHTVAFTHGDGRLRVYNLYSNSTAPADMKKLADFVQRSRYIVGYRL